ncbi:uncharacterized protein LOC126837512 [Adelges cooleyi]|uniref:uncharacterized protein LOC126837512 n=1 Tax=Adelges cooleyi TaxID=133065 RepID=UPI00217F403E|nr:uncharacterized protein LOC126837512 [Adelges cooleyi]
MFCHVFIGVLFYTVLICKHSFGADESESSHADQLNAILGLPGWERITHVNAKCRLAVNGNGLFTAEDLLVTGSTLIIPDENAKHYMVSHLVACVYVNAMVKFIDLLKNIVVEYRRARRSVANHIDYVKRRKLTEAVEEEGAEEEGNPVEEPELEEQNDNSEDGPTNDYKVPREIFDLALLQLTSNSEIFARMYSAIRYLVDTIPSGEYTLHVLEEEVLPCLKKFKDVSRNLGLVLGREYTGRIEPDHNRRMTFFSRQLSRFLIGEAKPFVEFLEKYCTMSETSAVSSVGEQTRLLRLRKLKTPTNVANQFGEEIKKLVDEVSEIYYSQLGFVYNSVEQTTSLASRPIPCTVSWETFSASDDLNLS